MELRKLSSMSPAERKAAVDELGRKAQAPRNGQAKGLDARIRAFEVRYEMKSEEMRSRFASGSLRDTADISRWLMLLRVRDR